MTVIISGTDGVSDVDGSASTPAIRGTDANTGIFFPAADTIAFAEGGVESMRIDDSGRVGIGNTNAGSYDAVGRNLVIGNASGNTGLTISSGSANSGWILFADGTTGTAPYVGYVEYSHANNTMNFITNAGERGRFVTNGLQVTNCVGVGNTAPSSSGAGITFPATQSASSDANTLDDYEEGTWTPIVAGSTTAGTATYLTQQGTYLKVGGLVFFRCFLNWNSGTGTGAFQVKDLPFTCSGYTAVTISYPNNLALSANKYLCAGYIEQSTTYLYVNEQSLGGGAVGNAPYDAAGEIMVSGCYRV